MDWDKVHSHQMDEWNNERIVELVVNKLQKVLTYFICRQMDEMPRWHFICHVGMYVGIWCGD
jgi:hypothetical protein